LKDRRGRKTHLKGNLSGSGKGVRTYKQRDRKIGASQGLSTYERPERCLPAPARKKGECGGTNIRNGKGKNREVSLAVGLGT